MLPHDAAEAWRALSFMRMRNPFSSMGVLLAFAYVGGKQGMETGVCRHASADPAKGKSMPIPISLNPAQVVVLAAGYDTRCYRLKTGNTQVGSCASCHKPKCLPPTVKNETKYHEQFPPGQGVLARPCLQGRDEHCPNALPGPAAAWTSAYV